MQSQRSVTRRQWGVTRLAGSVICFRGAQTVIDNFQLSIFGGLWLRATVRVWVMIRVGVWVRVRVMVGVMVSMVVVSG